MTDLISAADRPLFERFCEAVVPGFEAPGSLRYLQALAAGLPPDDQTALRAAAAQAAQWMRDAVPLADVELTREFGWLRALVIESYYSGYRAPDATGPDAWELIGFAEAPMARVAVRDFSFLPVVEVS